MQLENVMMMEILFWVKSFLLVDNEARSFLVWSIISTLKLSEQSILNHLFIDRIMPIRTILKSIETQKFYYKLSHHTIITKALNTVSFFFAFAEFKLHSN